MDYSDRIYIVLFSAGFAFLTLIGYYVVLRYEDDIKAYQEIINKQEQHITDLQRQVEHLKHKVRRSRRCQE